ncbi:MAG: HD domain-containing protein [Lachnospiraceae bacterium]|nr:HD domain-containing protein [Lachnospiraceae bacterium]
MSKKRSYFASADDSRGTIILVLSIIMLLLGLIGIKVKINHDLSTPFSYHMHFESTEGMASSEEGNTDGSVSVRDDYTYAVNISKHWLNDPGVPLQTNGAQYDNVITNNSDYDLVKWSVVIEVPEKNITIDSSWNGEWVYDKKNSTITVTPDERIATIRSGEKADFGAVMISKELMNFTDVNLTGCRYKPMRAFPLFWLIMILIVAWATSVIAYILYRIREENHRKNSERLNNVISQTMTTFANFIDTKDRYTKGHSARVSYYSQKIAEKLGMSEDEVRDIGYIGLMHDCGKLAIPGTILNKPGTLTEEEFDIMRSHTTNGGSILSEFSAIEGIKDGALYHHERYDGKGYMEGLSGEDIPLVARIIGVADALDAMNSDRCYRNHLSRDVIIAELENNKGTQFDPKIAQITIDMIQNGEIFIENGD